MLVVGTVVTRTVYDQRIGGFGLGRGQGRSDAVSENQLRSALDESLAPALLVGVGAALITAAIVAMFVGARLLRPIDELRAATRRMADGDYSSAVPVPAEAELASLARDVNELGAHLAATEQRRHPAARRGDPRVAHADHGDPRPDRSARRRGRHAVAGGLRGDRRRGRSSAADGRRSRRCSRGPRKEPWRSTSQTSISPRRQRSRPNGCGHSSTSPASRSSSR